MHSILIKYSDDVYFYFRHDRVHPYGSLCGVEKTWMWDGLASCIVSAALVVPFLSFTLGTYFLPSFSAHRCYVPISIGKKL